MTALPFHTSTTTHEVCRDIDLTGQRWLVTGAASGLGRETARALGAAGACVWVLARTVAQARETLEALDIEGIPFGADLADLDAVRRVVQEAREQGPLDGIIANAAVMALPTLQQANGVELHFAVNHLGHFALVTGLLDALVPDGRVVVVTSDAHRFTEGLELDNLAGERDYDPWRMYGRSKLANLLFVRALARRRVHANAAHPGPARTQLARHLDDPDALYDPIHEHLKTIPQAAATQVMLAVRPELAEVRGQHFSDCALEAPADEALDDADAEALWTLSEALVRQKGRS